MQSHRTLLDMVSAGAPRRSSPDEITAQFWGAVPGQNLDVESSSPFSRGDASLSFSGIGALDGNADVRNEAMERAVETGLVASLIIVAMMAAFVIVAHTGISSFFNQHDIAITPPPPPGVSAQPVIAPQDSSGPTQAIMITLPSDGDAPPRQLVIRGLDEGQIIELTAQGAAGSPQVETVIAGDATAPIALELEPLSATREPEPKKRPKRKRVSNPIAANPY